MTEIRANQVIDISLIHSQDDLTSEHQQVKPFHPDFTHQIFPDEKIEGHSKPKIQLIFHASDMSLCMRITCDSIKGAMTDIDSHMRKVIHHPFVSDVSALFANPRQFTPSGEKVHEYSLSSDGSDAIKYEIFSSDLSNPTFAAFHRRIQIFTLFFIDGASYIDENDPRWFVYTLFQRKEDQAGGDVQYSFVGFTTVYNFFAYPEHSRKRISQFVILPPFQRQGHGYRFLSTVHSLSLMDKNCIELCVEDPTDNFQNLRLLVELVLCHKEQVFDFTNPAIREKFWNLTKESVAELVSRLRLTTNSIRRIHEIMKFRALGPAPTDQESKEFRLGVKRRLYKRHEDELEGVEDSVRKERLQELFDETVKETERLSQRFDQLI
eukprot:c1332_g1_i1.p1 GENE.c1332_g1_i1~~c1332_g1_i1.p1  ORF type:complete len:398 (+),score=104.52 c1332_g1_i1:59-1195(+)